MRAASEEPKPEPLPISPQMEALLAQFAKAKENPADFNGWTALISAADKLVRFCPLILTLTDRHGRHTQILVNIVGCLKTASE